MRLKPRYSKTKMSSQRRSHLKEWVLFNNFHVFKLRMKHGRRKTIHWWRKV
jgi:hypothetical protein